MLKKTDTDPEALKLPEEVRRLVIKVNQAEKEKLAGQERDVLLVILAERLHNMRTIEHMDEKARKKKAEETLELFLPIAAKLGNEKLAAELNDLALNYYK